MTHCTRSDVLPLSYASMSDKLCFCLSFGGSAPQYPLPSPPHPPLRPPPLLSSPLSSPPAPAPARRLSVFMRHLSEPAALSEEELTSLTSNFPSPSFACPSAANQPPPARALGVPLLASRLSILPRGFFGRSSPSPSPSPSPPPQRRQSPSILPVPPCSGPSWELPTT